mmetsp:Transcript_4725/g.12198  ORF Transcript_4725/g.12198 Transcript_4725/m.12198 type:complete len:817 (+) Transcript_4725:159-2609(+)|eukprot:jgi/Tetstr1/429090/TSEL_019054.t1
MARGGDSPAEPERERERQRDRRRREEHSPQRDRKRSSSRREREEAEEGELGGGSAMPPPPPVPMPAGGAGESVDYEALGAQTSDNGGELSMSVAETNRVRAALGLKPLSDNSSSKDKEKSEEQAHQDRVEKADKARKAEELAAKVAEARDKRRLNASYKATKTLGEADAEGDDLAAWVKKNRVLEEKRRKKEREAAARMARQLEEQDEDAEDSDEEGPYNAKALAGMKVKHTAEELDAGSTMILTLEDQSILDEKGNLVEEGEDTLVDSLITEDKKKQKAKKAAMKKGVPLFGEDGKRRAILDKYDEEGDGEAMELGADGSVDPEKLKRQQEIRARLAAGATGIKEDLTAAEAKPASDYYTTEEMASLFKPKTKKKRKKEKKLRTKDTSDVIAALEAEIAAAGGAGAGGGDLGSRGSRVSRVEMAAKQELAKAEKRASAYQAALDKANKASEALRAAPADKADEWDEAEEADDELQASLARARRTAAKKAAAGSGKVDSVMELMKQTDSAAAKVDPVEEGIQFTEATEFCRSIAVDEDKPDAAAAAPREMDGDVDMEDAMEGGAAPADAPPPADKMEEDGGAAEGAEGEEAAKDEEPAAGGSSGAVFTGNSMGKGMFAALSNLRDTGALRNHKEWGGRTNDMKAVNLQGIDNMYETDEGTRINTSIEAALTKRDEFGRVMTPKEAFRQLCYQFHGIQPSKNKQEKRLRKYQEDLAVKKMEAGDTPLNSVDRLRDAQEATAQPFLVLSGKSAASEGSLRAAVTKKAAALAEAASGSGGLTPMLGDRKVEMMLGIKKAGSSGGGGGGGGAPVKKGHLY